MPNQFTCSIGLTSLIYVVYFNKKIMINKNQLNKSPQDFKFKLIKHDFQDSED